MNFGLSWCVNVVSLIVKVWNFDDGRDCVCVETGDRWEISESSTQFYCKPKTALSILKKKDLICFITYVYSRRNTECICKETSHFIEQILKH